MGFAIWKAEKVGNKVEFKLTKRLIVTHAIILCVVLVIGSIVAGVMFGIVIPNREREADERFKKVGEENHRRFNEATSSMQNESNINASKQDAEFASRAKDRDERFNQDRNSAIGMINKNFPTQNDNFQPTPTNQPNPKPTQIPPSNNNRGGQNNSDNFNKQVNSSKCEFNCFGVNSECSFGCRFDKKCEEQCTKSYQECTSKC